MSFRNTPLAEWRRGGQAGGRGRSPVGKAGAGGQGWGGANQYTTAQSTETHVQPPPLHGLRLAETHPRVQNTERHGKWTNQHVGTKFVRKDRDAQSHQRETAMRDPTDEGQTLSGTLSAVLLWEERHVP